MAPEAPGREPGAPTGGSPAVPAPADRIEWLFRDSLRRRQVHPLMDLLRRYRGGDAG
jgi:hypothetical protein